MRVAFYSAQVLENWGGLEKYFVETSTELSSRYPNVSADIVTNGNKFSRKLDTLFKYYYGGTENSESRRELHENIVGRLTGDVQYFKAESLKELREILLRYDVIYTKNEILELVVLTFLGIKKLRPIVVGCHTALQYPNPKQMKYRLRNRIYSGMPYQLLCRNIQAIHVLNESDFEMAEKLSNRVSLIPNPFDVNKFRKLSEVSSTSEIRVNEQAFNIAWVGRLAEQKGIAELLELISKYKLQRAGGVQADWHIFGDGQYRNEVISAIGTEKDLKYYGYVKGEDLAPVLKRCNLLISTSRWEGMPYNLLEAVGLGLPVITFDIPGARCIVIDGENGFLVTSIDSFFAKIKFLITGGSVNQAGCGMQRFDPPTVYQNLYDLLADAIQPQ